MKILYLVDHNGLGGVQRILDDFRRVRPYWNYGVVFDRGPDRWLQDLDISGYPKSFLGFMRSVRSVKEFVRDKGVNCIHVHLPAALMIGMFIKWTQPSVKLIYQEEGPAMAESISFKVLWTLAKLFVDHTISLNQASARLLRTKPITVIYNPVHQFQVKEIRSPAEKGFTIGFAGRITRAKGWRRFLELAQYLDSRRPGYFKYLIAGIGPEDQELDQCLNTKYHQLNITRLGLVADMSSFYNEIDMFVLTSHAEASGLTHLEAQSAGVLVAISGTEGPLETVQIEGSAIILDNESNGNEWGEVIAEILLNSTEWKSIKEKGKQNASLFTTQSTVRKIEMVYSSLLQ